jgi:hypothetical protein
MCSYMCSCAHSRINTSLLFGSLSKGDSVVLMDHDWVPRLSGRKSITAPIRKYLAAFQANQVRLACVV